LLADGQIISKLFWTHFEEENIVADVVIAVKSLNAGKTTGCDEIQPEMLKALNRGIIWLNRVCQVHSVPMACRGAALPSAQYIKKVIIYKQMS